jgi:hypothetical protein
MAIDFLTGVSVDGNSAVTGTFSVSSISNDNSTYTGIMVWDGGVLKYRTKAQVLSDIGATSNLGTVTSVTVQGSSGLSGSGTVTSSGTITLTNSDRGSSQAIYKNIATQSGTATANSNNDTLTITGTGGTTTSRSGDTITINSSDNNDNYYVTGLSFNTGNGILTATRNGGLASLTVDLDGRYVTSSGVTSVATGNGLTGGTITGSGTISVDYGVNGLIADAPGGTGNPDSDDYVLVGLDSSGSGETVSYALVDLPFTNNQGDITAVSAGSGLSGGGTTGSVTLNVDYGASSNVIMDTSAVYSLEGKDFFLVADFSNSNKVFYTDLSTLSGFIAGNIGSFTNLTINNTLNVRGAIDLQDNDILRFGTSDDIEMFFSGSDMFMDINNGEDFKIRDGNSGNATRFTFDADNGNFTATGNITAFSDERLKDNIETLDGSKVLDMRGVSYTKDGKAGSGVIAQELEKVAPELVMTNEKEDGMKSVAYGNLVGYLIEAVKDQQKQINDLKAQLDGLSK